MGLAPGYLIDTNVLLRLFRLDDPRQQLIKTAIKELKERDAGLYFAMQNIAEFWNVCTRPAELNGFGLSTAETSQCVEQIERTMTFLPDSERVYSFWRQIVSRLGVRGVQVHDARLAAIMEAYGLTHILTMNQQDFLRYPTIQAIHPNQVQPSAR
jgi:predicted nucleic acid-binding protein